MTVALAVAAHCSLALDWSPDGLPCDPSKVCDPGFSCLGDECVADASLPIGATCNATSQCADSPSTDTCRSDSSQCVVCGSSPPFTCRRRCLGNYLAAVASQCGSGEYCRAEPDRDKPALWTGTCMASECSSDLDCRESAGVSRQCVAVTPNANACLQTCEVTVTAGVYRDTCGSAAGARVYCQPIGPQGNRSLVCLSRLEADTTSPPNLGQLCTVIELPCRSGDVCVGGSETYCRRYCDAASSDPVTHVNAYCPPSAAYCCPTVTGETSYAVCLDGGCSD